MKSCCAHRKPALDTGFRPAKEMGEYEGDRRRSRSDSISETRRSRSSSRGRLDRSSSRERLDRSSSRGRLEQPPSKRRPERSESRGNLGPLREERENSQSRLMKSTFSSRSKSRDRSLHEFNKNSGFQAEPRKYSGSQTLPRNLGKERRKSNGYGGYNPTNDSDASSTTLPRNGSRGRSPPKSVSKTWITPSPSSGASFTPFTPSARPIITPDTLPSYTSRPASRMSPTDSLSFPKTLPFGSTSNFGPASSMAAPSYPSMAPPSYAPFRSSKSPDRAYRRSPTPDRQIPIQIKGRSVSRDTGVGRSSSSYTNNNSTQSSHTSSKISSLSSSASSSSYAQKSSSSMLRSSSFKENEGYKSSSSSGGRKGVTKIGLSSLRKPIIEDPEDKPEPLGTNNNRPGTDSTSSSKWTGTKHMSSVSNSMSRKSSYSSHVM